MKARGKKKRGVLSRLIAFPKTLVFRRRISRMPKRSKGRLLYALWRYTEPKEFGFKKLPRMPNLKNRGSVHFLKKYISGRIAERALSLPSGGFELTVGVSFYKVGETIAADVFVVSKPYLSGRRGFITLKEAASLPQITAFKAEQKNLERAVKVLAENLGLKESDKLEINFLY